MPDPFWKDEQDLTDAEQERIKPDKEFDADNPDGAAKSVRSAKDLEYSSHIEGVLDDRADAIQSIDNDPDKPDRFEDDVYASDARAEQALRAVFQRGLGAAQSSRGVDSAVQWGLARVDEFAGIVKTGEPDDSEYQQDNDLLPFGHPERSVEYEDLDDEPFVEGVPGEATKDELEPLFDERL
jgi:hypothetical protein